MARRVLRRCGDDQKRYQKLGNNTIHAEIVLVGRLRATDAAEAVIRNVADSDIM